MKFGQFINETEEKVNDVKEKKTTTLAKKKMRGVLKSQLQKLDADIDKIMDAVEKEIDNIEENPIRGHAEGVPRDGNEEVVKAVNNTPKIISNKDLDKSIKK